MKLSRCRQADIPYERFDRPRGCPSRKRGQNANTDKVRDSTSPLSIRCTYRDGSRISRGSAPSHSSNILICMGYERGKVGMGVGSSAWLHHSEGARLRRSLDPILSFPLQGETHGNLVQRSFFLGITSAMSRLSSARALLWAAAIASKSPAGTDSLMSARRWAMMCLPVLSCTIQ